MGGEGAIGSGGEHSRWAIKEMWVVVGDAVKFCMIFLRDNLV